MTKKQVSNPSREISQVQPMNSSPNKAFTGEFNFAQQFALMLQDIDLESSNGAVGVDDLFQMLVDCSLTEFCDLCEVYLVDPSQGLTKRFVGAREASHSPGNLLSGSQIDQNNHSLEGSPLVQRMCEQALIAGSPRTWPEEETNSDATRCVVVPISVNNFPYGAIAFIKYEVAGFQSGDVTLAMEAVQLLAHSMELLSNVRSPTSSDRPGVRLVSQLNLLHRAVSSMAEIDDVAELMLRLATNLQTVFDADEARVSLWIGQYSPIAAVQRRNEQALISTQDAEILRTVHQSTSHGGSPWREGSSMAAALLDSAGTIRGEVSVERKNMVDFGDEELEVIKLFAQIAMNALGAVELRQVIRSSETRLRLLIDNAPVAIIEIGTNGQVRWWNRSAAGIFSWPEFSELPVLTNPQFPSSLRDGLSQLWFKTLEGSESSSIDFNDVRIGGQSKDLTVLATLLPSVDGHQRRIWTLVNDVTDYRRMQSDLRSIERLELRAQVASSVAHDFNNLLSLISGYAEILQNDFVADERTALMVSDIQATAARASVLTTQLQMVGRTNVGNPIVMSPASEVQALAEVLERIVGPEIEIHWSLDSTSANVRLDVDQFEQMILNLTLNARDAMMAGGELTISVEEVTITEESRAGYALNVGSYLLIVVSDNGAGMDEETLRRCFEPLFTTKGPLKGNGLGLSTAKRFVEESGGIIQCESQLGAGTTFRVFLPKVLEDVSNRNRRSGGGRLRGSSKILIVEENTELRHFISQVLERNGHQIVEADNCERAIQLESIFDGAIELAIVGNYSGSKDAPALLDKLRQGNPSMKLLVLSEDGDDHSPTTALENSYVLGVPIRPSELIDCVHRILAAPLTKSS